MKKIRKKKTFEMEKLDKNGNAKINAEKALESDEEKKYRFLSLYIIYFTLFLQSLGLAIAMTGVWPYVSKVINFEFRTLRTLS